MSTADQEMRATNQTGTQLICMNDPAFGRTGVNTGSEMKQSHEESIANDENNLFLRKDGKDHFVDTITKYRKSKLGQPFFRLGLYCECC